MGEQVSGVIPASTFGLLPAPLDPPPSVPANHRCPLNTKFRYDIEQHDVNRAGSSGTPSEGVKEDQTVAEEHKHVGEGKGGISTIASTPMLLEKMLHLFGHGTPTSLELELKRVGTEALRALRTPDVGIHGYL